MEKRKNSNESEYDDKKRLRVDDVSRSSLYSTDDVILKDKKKKKNKKSKKSTKNNKKDTKSKTIQPKEPPICKYYINGACTKGKECQFLHKGDIIKKTEICKFFKSESCMKGADCVYSHDLTSDPCRYFLLGKCNVDNCRFGHFIPNDFVPLTNSTPHITSGDSMLDAIFSPLIPVGDANNITGNVNNITSFNSLTTHKQQINNYNNDNNDNNLTEGGYLSQCFVPIEFNGTMEETSFNITSYKDNDNNDYSRNTSFLLSEVLQIKKE